MAAKRNVALRLYHSVPSNEHIAELENSLYNKSSKEWTLDEWIVMLYGIYRQHDYSYGPSELWLQVVKDASQLAEYVRRDNLKKALSKAVRLFCWLSSFVGKYTLEPTLSLIHDPINTLLKVPPTIPSYDDFIGGPESYTKWILTKYPRICPICCYDRCQCPSNREIVEKRREQPIEYIHLIDGRKNRRDSARKMFRPNRQGLPSLATKSIYDYSLDKFINMLTTIYHGAHFDMDLPKIAFHLLEEIGEVSDEILYLHHLHRARKEKHNYRDIFEHAKGYFEKVEIETALQKDKINLRNENDLYNYILFQITDNLREELADVFSWLTALLHKIGEIWRAHRDEPPRYYSFADDLLSRFSNERLHIGCPYCASRRCDIHCLVRTATWKALEKVLDRYREDTWPADIRSRQHMAEGRKK